MRRTIALAAVALGLVPAARADIITENLGGTATFATGSYFGQSLVTPAGGPWHNLTFNFFSNAPATTPTAVGTAFLLSQEYLGTPANLSTSTPGFLAASTGIVAGQYTFAPGVTVLPNTTYWVYENAALGGITGGNFSGTDQYYYAPSGSDNFRIPDFNINVNYRLSGDVVTSAVPAPPALVLAGLGAGCVATKRLLRRRANV
jgi:hypothetical protein